VPPRARSVDEQLGWFLDHFSRRELEAYLERGARSFLLRVALSASAALATCAAAAAVVAERVTSLSVDPGAIAVLAIVVAGFAAAVACYHLARLWQARVLARGAVDAAQIRAWLSGEARDEPLLAVARDAAVS
jgi:hypothetical protein